jgi:hypothetical protein
MQDQYDRLSEISRQASELSSEDYDKALNYEIENKIMEMAEENIDFVINVNNMIGNLGPKHFTSAVNAISTALFILQKEKALGYTVNITIIANKILKTQGNEAYQLNRAEILSFLYYIQQNMETIVMTNKPDEIPTWAIREDIFNKLASESAFLPKKKLPPATEATSSAQEVD